MKTDKLIDAIGMIDEKYVADAHKPCMKISHRKVKGFAIAAAAMLCIAVPLPAMTAFGSDTAYNLLYMAMPSVAQTFKPIQKSCEDKGIRMEVISADIQGDEAHFYISIQGDMIDETTDLYDSYNIKCPFDSVGHVSFSDFDKETKTAHFVVNIKTMNGEKIPKGKVTFSVRELIFDKHEFEGAIDGIDLSEVPKNPPTTKEVRYRGHGSKYEIDISDYSYLIPNAEPLSVPIDGVSVTGIGYIDGALHIQTYYENLLKTDNHGYVYLVDENGNLIGDNYFADISFWENDGDGSYDEKIIPVDYNELENCSLMGWFSTSNGYESGDWEVTFKMK
ncbi:MAG: DUF4179 domain-containing protein [Ruminococcus sp.]|nr:DUF4179 domain-containing protein [Ruminococcus sp.]